MPKLLISILWVILFTHQSVKASEINLSEIGVTNFNYKDGCYGLQFVAPVIKGRTLMIDGQSLAGKASMTIDFSKEPPSIKIIGFRISGSSSSLEHIDNAIRFAVKLYHMEGVCKFDFQVNGIANKEPEPDINQSQSAPKMPQGKALNYPVKEAKNICTDIGFIPNTEKFGECVLRLIEK